MNIELKVRKQGLFSLCGSKGFTLIELLVVISIIGILSGVLLTNFVGVRQRGRDGVRKSDLRQIQSALELYRSDYGRYPDLGSDPGNFPDTCGSGSQFDDGVVAGNPTVYMKKVPCDPLDEGVYVYTYKPVADGSTYSLVACLENVNDSQRDSVSSWDCDGGTDNWSYTVENP